MILLNYRKIDSPSPNQKPPLIVLHGLFGMLDNWLYLGKQYAQAGYTVYLIDQRNHGKSPHTNNINYYLLADDLYDFMNQHDIESAFILGHSMGGKVAMQFAVNYPERVFKLMVIDIAPKDYPPGHDDIFEGIFFVNLATTQDKTHIEAQLASKIKEPSVVDFLMKNLKRNTQTNMLEWKANFEALHQHYADIIMNSLSPFDQFDGQTLFVNGGNSQRYIAPQDYENIYKKFPAAQIHIIPQAGHWIHAEKPQELLECTLEFIKK